MALKNIEPVWLKGGAMEELLINERVIDEYGTAYRVLSSNHPNYFDHPMLIREDRQPMVFIPTKVFRDRRGRVQW